MTTRAEIIEEAKKALPSFEENTSKQVAIRVFDYNDIQSVYDGASMSWIESPKVNEVVFNRCLVGKEQIIQPFDEHFPGYELAWIPAEYFNISFPPNDLTSTRNWELLNAYMMK